MGVLSLGGHDARHISICSLFQGRFVTACYVKPKKGWVPTDSQHGLRQLEGVYGWIAMMARSRATARTDTAISKPCVCSYLLLAESGRP